MTADQINALMIEAENTGPFSKVMQLAMAAQENAATTIYEEKAAPESELAALTMASLEDALCYCDDKDAVAWFVARGVRF